jgi:prepilin-type N-terminal cleavage/methylation domain-containing protein
MKKFSKNANKVLRKAGFTLVELLTVMAILGILIAVAIAAVGIAQRGARDNTRTRDMTTIQGALNDYYGYSQTRSYPDKVDFIIVSDKFQITASGTPVSIQQKGVALSSQSIVGDKNNITKCGADATSSTWEINYAPSANNQDFLLCGKLENGQILNLSTGR